MGPIDPAAHGIVAAASRGQEPDPAKLTKQARADRDAVAMFLIRMTSDCLRRMRDGLRRGWGSGWKTGYGDEKVMDRLGTASNELADVLGLYREGVVGIDELRKRAADVANQAFMLADSERLRNNEP